MKRAAVVLLGMLALAAEPPKIDPKLQFRARTLQAEYQRIRAEIAELKLQQQAVAAEIAKAEQEMRAACGGEISISPAAGEWFCVVLHLAGEREPGEEYRWGE